jgi:hypothetical membrane protein
MLSRGGHATTLAASGQGIERRQHLPAEDAMTLVAAIAGLAGAALIVFAWIYGIAGYNSKTNKPFNRNYSPLTHLVSTLGHSSTPHSSVFNILLVVGAIALGLMMFGLALVVDDPAIRAIMAVGAILAGVAGMLVGIFPSGKPSEGSPHHLIFAFGFFVLSAAVVGVFTAHVLFNSQPGFGAGLAIPGILVVLAAALMLVAGLVKMIPGDTDWSVPDLVDNPAATVPSVMFLPVAEWAYVILLNIWVLVLSTFLLTR